MSPEVVDELYAGTSYRCSSTVVVEARRQNHDRDRATANKLGPTSTKDNRRRALVTNNRQLLRWPRHDRRALKRLSKECAENSVSPATRTILKRQTRYSEDDLPALFPSRQRVSF
jgi:hypothetical protein